MALIKFDDVLKVEDIPTVDIPVPEWGGSVRVKHWTKSQRDEFARRNSGDKSEDDKKKTQEWLICLLAINEDGTPWCTPEMFKELDKKNPKGVDAIVNGIIKLVSPVTEEDVKAAEKNS